MTDEPKNRWTYERELGEIVDDEGNPVATMVRGDAGLVLAAAPQLLAALERMDALVERLWKSVPWGKTWDLPVKELNEAPIQARIAIARAKGKQPSPGGRRDGT